MGAALPLCGNPGNVFSFRAAESFGNFVEQPSTRNTSAPDEATLSHWSDSGAKRCFDMACVLLALPIAVPLFLLVALAVRLTSRGPVLFRQQRMGRYGKTFTILKFRTMPVRADREHKPELATAANQRFTPIGPFLRRSKLDELPQLIHILRGEMSLVGPRPKLPCFESARLNCRPGLTGMATMIFAREEMALATLPQADVLAYYQDVVKPLKRRLDEEYMAQATFISDLRILLKCLFRAWDDVALTELPTRPGPHILAPTSGIAAVQRMRPRLALR